MVYAFIIIAATALIASWPLEPEINLIAGLIAAVILMFMPVSKNGQMGRAIAASIGVVIAMRYIWWRLGSTIPMDGAWYEIGLSSALAMAETFGLWSLFSGAFIGARPLKRKPKEPSGPADTWPTVDVMIPTYNEPWSVVGPTVAAAMAMEYPAHRMRVWLLDDGGTDARINDEDKHKAAQSMARREAFSRRAAELGAGYIARPDNNGAKAGNINYGLSQTSGDVILVLDCDHTPTRDFLQSTIGWIQHDPDIGLVQTPHFFTNPDPIQKNLGIENKVAPENDMFYYSMLQGADYHGSTFWCGSAALIRRTALMENGGVTERTVTEDADTSFSLIAAGWKTAYVEKPMVGGLQPHTIDAFTVQRSRWAVGMMQIVFKAPPFLRVGLSASQRICLSAFCMHWFFPFARLAFIFGPTFYLIFGIEIFRASAMEMVAYGLPHFLISQMLIHKLYGEVRGPFLGEIHDTAMAPFLAKSMIVSAIKGKATFSVTSKEDGGRDYISERISTMTGIFLYLIASMLIGFFFFAADSRNEDAFILCIIWTTWNLGLVSCAMGLFRERASTASRWRKCSIDATVKADGNEKFVRIVEISDGDVVFVGDGLFHITEGSRGSVTVDGQTMSGTLSHGDQGRIQLAVDMDDVESLKAHTSILFGDSSVWINALDIHKKRLNLFQGIGLFLSAVIYGLTGIRGGKSHENTTLRSPSVRVGTTRMKKIEVARGGMVLAPGILEKRT